MKNLLLIFRMLIDYAIVAFLLVIGFSELYVIPYVDYRTLNQFSLILVGFKGAMMIQSRNDRDIIKEIEILLDKEGTVKHINDLFNIDTD